MYPLTDEQHDSPNRVAEKILIILITLLLITISCLLVSLVAHYLFYSPGCSVSGEDFLFLDTYTKINLEPEVNASNGTGVKNRITCCNMLENYEDKFFEISLRLNKEEDFNKTIRGDWQIKCKKIPQDTLDKISNVGYPFSRISELKKETTYTTSGYWEYPEGVKNGNINLVYHKDGRIFSAKKETIFFYREIHFYNSPYLEVNASIDFLFPSEWVVITCHGDENVSILDRNINYVHSIAKNDDHLSYFMILKRDTTKIALKTTKIGIILTVIIAIASIVIALEKMIYDALFN